MSDIIVENVNETGYSKNCLLKYITGPFRQPVSSRPWHQNLWQVSALAGIIGEWGYNVDVIDWVAARIDFTKEYDLVVDISPHNRQIYESRLRPDCRELLYATGSSPQWQYRQEELRLAALFERCGVKLKPQTNQEYQYPHPNDFDHLLLMGNQHTLGTFENVEKTKVSLLKNNGCIVVPDLDFSLKSSRNFLFLASQPQVLKGLDLLLEVFPCNPQTTLYVCSLFEREPDFCTLYRQELFHCHNIKPIGFLDTSGPIFREIVRHCSYMILPSCSEGISGSALTAMSFGLVPLLSKECGINEDEGQILENCSIDCIAETVDRFSRMPADWIRKQSIRSLEVIRERYSPGAYIESVRKGLQQALGKPPETYGYEIARKKETWMIADTRIGIQLTGGKHWYGGVSHIRALVQCLCTLPKEERPQLYLVVTDKTLSDFEFYQPFAHLFDGIMFVGPNPEFLNKKLGSPSIHCQSWEEVFSLVDFYFPVNSDTLVTAKAMSWIPDFQHRYLPEFFSNYEYQFRESQFKKIAEQSRLIMFSTQAAAADFRKFYPQSTAEAVVFTPVSYPDENWYLPDPNQVRGKYSLPERFILCSNQFWLHKNHLTLFRAIQLLKQRGQNIPLVCTGPTEDYRAPAYFGELQSAIANLKISDQVTILGMIPREDQIQLIRQCLFVVQPSLFEGLGQIVLECRSLGKPIIVSDIDAHLEHQYGTVFQKSSPEDLAKKISALLPACHPGGNDAAEQQAKQEAQTAALKLAEQLCSFFLQQIDGRSRPVPQTAVAAIPLVTTLSPDNIANQQIAIKSWQQAGFRVIALNSREDIAALRPHFPNVDFVTAFRDARERYGQRYIYFRDLLHCCQKQSADIGGIIKSDLILRNNQLAALLQKEAAGSIIFGSRYDISAPDSTESTVHSGAFDYLFFDKHVLPDYPMESFCLGLPWWDYWALLLAIANDVPAKLLSSPLACHVGHTPRPNQETWQTLGLVLSRYAETDYAVTPETMAQYQQLLFHTIRDNATEIRF
ncbi:MAG: glycosyltransferase [Veillonellales bacterium]